MHDGFFSFSLWLCGWRAWEPVIIDLGLISGSSGLILQEIYSRQYLVSIQTFIFMGGGGFLSYYKLNLHFFWKNFIHPYKCKIRTFSSNLWFYSQSSRQNQNQWKIPKRARGIPPPLFIHYYIDVKFAHFPPICDSILTRSANLSFLSSKSLIYRKNCSGI